MSNQQKCPTCKATMSKRENPSTEAAWCGTWHDCAKCGSSVLDPSRELRNHLAAQKERAKA